MSSPSQAPQEPPSSKTKARTKNWPLWLGVGFFTLAGAALLASLVSFLGDDPTPSVADQKADVADAPEVTSAPPTPQEHQAIVSDAVSDLGRDVLIGDSPTQGNPDADVVLIKFSDFQCAYCSQATSQVGPFIEENEADVLFVYKHLPLTRIHPEALPAALASWAAGQQDQFWAFHDALFENQEDLSEDLYISIAEDLGLDLEQFDRDRDSEAAKAAVAQDLALSAELQISSTPTFIMNEVLIPGAVPTEFFAEALTRLQAAQ
jgi:protein-disulfide isomerase